VRWNLRNKPDRKVNPYLTLSDEVLISFGKGVTTNAFEQNRILLAVGLKSGDVQYQVGLMNRFVQVGPSTFTSNNMLVLWVTQKFDLRGSHRRDSEK
jgi:hypothetical protein